jgi:adenylylsulfate kinase
VSFLVDYLQPVPRGSRPRAAWLSGTVGVGKTSVADAMGDVLQTVGIAGAVIDADWLRRAWPTPAADRFYTAMELRNLAAVAANYVHAGHSSIIVAGVIEQRAARERYQQALGVKELTVCRLRVDLGLVRERLRARHANDPEGLTWHVNRMSELEAVLDRADVDDFEVEATGLSVAETAQVILHRLGWLTPSDDE